MMLRPVRPASAGCRAAAQQCPLSGKADTGAFPTEGSFSSPDCAKAARDRAAVAGSSARKRSRAAEAAVLSLPDRAARHRACQAAEALEKSHRGADGSSISLRRQ
jgi:hypothetical protein